MKKVMKLRMLIIFIVSISILLGNTNINAASLNWSSLEQKGVYKYGSHEFSEGLMCVLTNNGRNYIDETGMIVDLNKGRFTMVTPFSEGLAAVVDYDDKVGYINKSGDIVIPFEYGAYWGTGNVYVGYFKNGLATVFEETYAYDSTLLAAPEMMVGKIDKTGKLIQEYVKISKEKFKDWFIISDYGVTSGSSIVNNVNNQTTVPNITEPVVTDVIIVPETPKNSNTPSEWAKNEIQQADSLGLITQNTKSDFTSNITRFQFAELIVNMAEKAIKDEINPMTNTTFSDTQEKAILKAYQAGIVNGMGGTEFVPNANITREQMATMIYRAITYIEDKNGNKYVNRNADITAYHDRDMVSEWAMESIGVLVNNKIMNGTSEFNLSPKGNATIEQSILLIYRLYNIVK